MNPLIVVIAPDGSSLILGEDPHDPRQPYRLVFEHEGHGAPEPLRGVLPAFWITVNDRRHIVFAGDTLDEPDVDRVELEFPHHSQTCRVRPTRRRGVWMSFAEPFAPFEPPPAEPSIPPGGVVIASWLARHGRVTHSEQTAPLEWGAPVPPKIEPPPPEWPQVRSPEEDPDGWTGYAHS